MAGIEEEQTNSSQSVEVKDETSLKKLLLKPITGTIHFESHDPTVDREHVSRFKMFTTGGLSVGEMSLTMQNRFQVTSTPKGAPTVGLRVFDRLRLLASSSQGKSLSLLADFRFDNNGFMGHPLIGASTDKLVRTVGASAGFTEVSFNDEQLSLALLYAKKFGNQGPQVSAFLYCNKIEGNEGTCFVEGAVLTPRLINVGQVKVHLSVGAEKVDVMNNRSPFRVIFGAVLSK